jgi:hypothetical protein
MGPMQTTREPVPGPAEKEAAGFGIDLSQLNYLLSLTPYERLQRHEQALDLVSAVRKAGIQLYGFDPRSADSPDQS